MTTDRHIAEEIADCVRNAGAPPIVPFVEEKFSRGSRPRAKGGKGRAATAKRNRGGNGHLPPAEDQLELDKRLAFFPLTDLGNAERFRERERGRFLWATNMGWLFWTGERWSLEGADEKVRIAAHETVRSIQDEADAIRGTPADRLIEPAGKGKEELYYSDMVEDWGRKSETNAKLNNLAEQAGAYLAVKPAELDRDPMCINVANGTLFVRGPNDQRPLPARAAGVEADGYIYFLPHDPDDLCTKISPCDYDPAATCDRFMQFLIEVQPDEKMRRQLAAWRGYSLTGDVGEQKLCLFYGGGRNGKSVFEDICAFVAGDYASAIMIDSFIEQRTRAGQATPDLAMLPGVRMLRASEPNRSSKLNEGLIKSVTGGDIITARHLNKPFFQFYPQFKLTISGNHRPRIAGADEGIWRRIVLTPWTVTIEKQKQNPNLAIELRAEASGILNYMLDGLRDWLEHGFVLAKQTQEATDEYRRDSDQLGRFLEDCTMKAELDQQTGASQLLDVLNEWHRLHKLRPWGGRTFSDAMAERGFKKTKNSTVFYLGILLNDEGEALWRYHVARRTEAANAARAGASTSEQPSDAVSDADTEGL